jgi:hypothetical protein
VCVSDTCEVHSKPFSQQRRNAEFRGISRCFWWECGSETDGWHGYGGAVAGAAAYRATDTQTGHVGGGCSASGAAHGPLSVLRRRRGRPGGAHGVRRSVRRCQGDVALNSVFRWSVGNGPTAAQSTPHLYRSSPHSPLESPSSNSLSTSTWLEPPSKCQGKVTHESSTHESRVQREDTTPHIVQEEVLQHTVH